MRKNFILLHRVILMNHRKFLSFSSLITCFLLLQACPTKPGNSDDFLISNASIDSIVVLKNSNQHLQLKLYTITGSPCHEFSHIDIEDKNGQFFITPYAKINRRTVCIDILGNLEMDMDIFVPSSGNYQFHFQNSHNVLDTMLFVH